MSEIIKRTTSKTRGRHRRPQWTQSVPPTGFEPTRCGRNCLWVDIFSMLFSMLFSELNFFFSGRADSFAKRTGLWFPIDWRKNQLAAIKLSGVLRKTWAWRTHGRTDFFFHNMHTPYTHTITEYAPCGRNHILDIYMNPSTSKCPRNRQNKSKTKNGKININYVQKKE